MDITASQNLQMDVRLYGKKNDFHVTYKNVKVNAFKGHLSMKNASYALNGSHHYEKYNGHTDLYFSTFEHSNVNCTGLFGAWFYSEAQECTMEIRNELERENPDCVEDKSKPFLYWRLNDDSPVFCPESIKVLFHPMD